MCIELTGFECEPSGLRVGMNNVEFIITYNNPGAAGDVMSGRIGSTRPNDPYRFVLGTGNQVRIKEFQHTLGEGAGEVRVSAVIRITAPAGTHGHIQFALGYRLSTGATGCPNAFTNVNF